MNCQLTQPDCAASTCPERDPPSITIAFTATRWSSWAHLAKRTLVRLQILFELVLSHLPLTFPSPTKASSSTVSSLSLDITADAVRIRSAGAHFGARLLSELQLKKYPAHSLTTRPRTIAALTAPPAACLPQNPKDINHPLNPPDHHHPQWRNSYALRYSARPSRSPRGMWYAYSSPIHD